MIEPFRRLYYLLWLNVKEIIASSANFFQIIILALIKLIIFGMIIDKVNYDNIKVIELGFLVIIFSYSAILMSDYLFKLDQYKQSYVDALKESGCESEVIIVSRVITHYALSNIFLLIILPLFNFLIKPQICIVQMALSMILASSVISIITIFCYSVVNNDNTKLLTNILSSVIFFLIIPVNLAILLYLTENNPAGIAIVAGELLISLAISLIFARHII